MGIDVGFIWGGEKWFGFLCCIVLGVLFMLRWMINFWGIGLSVMRRGFLDLCNVVVLKEEFGIYFVGRSEGFYL